MSSKEQNTIKDTSANIKSNNTGKNTSSNHTLKINNLGFKYLNSQQIFENISFEISTNESICLLGPNGCGKTTLMSCLIGLNKQTQGEITIDGKNTRKMPDKDIAKNIGFVNQIITSTFDYKVIDYVVCGCAPHLKLFKRPSDTEYEQAFESLKTMQITHLENKSFAQLSGGEQQQVTIARVLTQRPNFILLDEPTSHLDFGNQVRVLKLIKEMANNNFGVIMTTHNPDHALMMEGKTVMMKTCGNYEYGKTEDILTEETLRKLYEINLFLEQSEHAKRKTCVAPCV